MGNTMAIYSDLGEPFVSTFDTSKVMDPIYANEYELYPPIIGIVSSSVIVDWGDGTRTRASSVTDPNLKHTYAAVGIYEVKIYGSFNVGYRTGVAAVPAAVYREKSQNKILNVSNWGQSRIANHAAWRGCTNLTGFTATNQPVLITNSFYWMFGGCSSFVSGIGHWNISNITSLEACFFQCFVFNDNLGNWSTGNITNMTSSFQSCSNFNNGGVDSMGQWDVSKVTIFQNAFNLCSNFNQNLSAWNVSSGINFNTMLGACVQYNNQNNSGIQYWNMSNATNTGAMFRGTQFNQPLSWDVSKVTSTRDMFATCPFNQNIGAWNVSSVTDMSMMFRDNTAFDNGGSNSIGNWDVSKVEFFSRMFEGSTAFQRDISTWIISSATHVDSMFFRSNYNKALDALNVSSVQYFEKMFATSPYNQPLPSWNTGNAVSMKDMFNNSSFNQSLNTWSFVSINTDFSSPGSGGVGLLSFGNMQTTYYDEMLIKFDNEIVTPALKISVGITKYTSAAATARANLITKGWTIIDGGLL